MYGKLSAWITKRFIARGIIDADKQDIYEYGFEVLISYTVYTLLFIGIAALTGSLLQSLVFWLGFLVIRTLAGGFHAGSYISCHLLFAVNHLIFIALLKWTAGQVHKGLILAIMVVAAIAILIFAPVDHKNKRFTPAEYKKFRIKSRVYSLFILALSVVLFILFESNQWYFSFVIGTVSATVSLICAKIKKHIERKEESC